MATWKLVACKRYYGSREVLTTRNNPSKRTSRVALWPEMLET